MHQPYSYSPLGTNQEPPYIIIERNNLWRIIDRKSGILIRNSRDSLVDNGGYKSRNFAEKNYLNSMRQASVAPSTVPKVLSNHKVLPHTLGIKASEYVEPDDLIVIVNSFVRALEIHKVVLDPIDPLTIFH